MPENKARKGTTQKGRQPQRSPGKAGRSGARNSSEPPTENRPLERREKQKQAEEENRRRTARQAKLEKTQSRTHLAEPESPREDPEE